MFDIFEPDTRGAVYSDETTSTVRSFVAVEDPSSPAMPAMAPSTTPNYKSSATQTEELSASSTVCGCADVQRSRGCSKSTQAPPESTATAPQSATTLNKSPPKSTQSSQASTSKSTTVSKSPAASKSPTAPKSPTASKSPAASSPPSNDLSETEVQAILDAIPIRDYHVGRDLLPIVGSVEVCEDAIRAAAKAKDKMFEEATVLEWKIRLRQTLYSLKIRERENKAWEENNRLKQAFPAGVVRAKNATDPRICDDLQPLPATSDPKIELQDAIEAWRDTVDGRAEDYCSASSGEHWWKYMEYEDFHGIDNNEFHDYFPNVPCKIVYHSTAVQTKQIISGLVHKKVFGREPTKTESRKILRSIGSPDYVDQSEVWYGEPFLDPNGPYLDVQTETQDSGFQTMDFEIREANILKAKAKAGITASKLNKLSIERHNGIRVFVEPSKDRVVHSQQFTALRAVVDKSGTVESYGNFTPMIHNVVYEDIEKKPVTTVTLIHATPLASPSPKSLAQMNTPTMKAIELKDISSYCRSPSPGPYEDAQINDPELFEYGWPMNQCLLKEVDGAYSRDVCKDFAVPDLNRFHKTVREQAHTRTKPDTSAHRASAPIPAQQTPIATKSSLAATSVQKSSDTMKTPHTPTQEEDKGRTKKRSSDHLLDEGYKSHSTSSVSKRHRYGECTAASMSHFPTPYDTPFSSDDAKVTTPTSTCPNSATPKTDDTTTLEQISNKRKRDAAPAQEPSGKAEESSSKRAKLQPTPTPIRRLPPTESTLKVIIPKGNLKSRAQMNQKASPTVTQATCMTPTNGADAETAGAQQQEPTRQQVKDAKSVPPAPKKSPAPAPSRPSWADRKPTWKRDNKKENPNRWRKDLGGAGIGLRTEPYDASGRPSRRN